MAIAFSDQETPSGTIDGTNPSFTLANIPSPAASLQLVLNGVTQDQGDDYSLSSSTVTFVNPPQAGGTLQAWYRYVTPSTASGYGPTIQDLLRSSFRCINQLRPGYVYSPSELVDGLFILNAMLESWSVDDLNCFCTLISQFPLVPGQQSYTIGPGGDFNVTRPVKIDKATLVVMTNPAQPLRLDLDLINAEYWQYIHLQSTSSTLAQKCFYAQTFPLATVNLWPVPTESDLIELSSMQAIASGFTDGTPVFSAPPGYLDAVRYNLAVRLAMEWNQPLKPGVAALASEALANIQRRNDVTPQMSCNPGVLPVSGVRTGWSRLTGD